MRKVVPPTEGKGPNSINKNWNALGHLVSYLLKFKMNFEVALKYLLTKILLSLCHADGINQSSPKSDLL